MPRETPAPGSPESWMRYAYSDLVLASQPTVEGVLPQTLCFHAQQAAEKALKAVLVAVGIDFPRTHDLARLIALVDSTPVVFPEELRDAAGLSVYAVAARYPAPWGEVAEDERQQALDIARQVVAWAEGSLKDISA